MKYKIYIALLLLAFGVSIYLNQKLQNPENSTASHYEPKNTNQPAQVNEEISIREDTEQNVKASNQLTQKIEPKPSPDNTGTTDLSVENTEASEPEPTDENSNMLAKGEYFDEVNTPNKCDGSCDADNGGTVENLEIADKTTVNSPATGEFADQINSDAIFKLAQEKDPNLQPEAPLVEAPGSSSPPLEIGVYSPPL